MRPIIQLVGAIALASAASAQVVLDFEDLVGFAPIPNGYGGIADWGSWAHSDLPDPNYPAASGVVKVLSVGLQQRIQFGQDVVFEGANVVSALPFAWRMFHQGQLVATSATLQPNTGGPAVWLASGYAGPVDELEYQSAVNVHGVDDFTYSLPAQGIGSVYCTGNPNDTGVPGEISAVGSTTAANNDLTLTASSLPANQFGIFVTSRIQDLVPNVGNGTLCLGGVVGRFNQPSQIQSTGATGSFSLVVDLTLMPQGGTVASVMAGETWSFQAWHREFSGAGSNFTGGLEIAFQ